MKRLLTIDGGGCKGVIPSVILQHIEERINAPIRNYFDLIAGTSTGGIIALVLAHPKKFTTSQCLDFYVHNASLIFKTNWKHKIRTGFSLWGAKHSSNNLDNILKQNFGNISIKEALTKVMVVSFDYTEYKTKVIKSYKHEMTFHQAAMSTTAAPIYFKPFLLDKNHMIDGSIFANNPSLCAYVEMLKLFPKEDYKVLSLGTGFKKANGLPTNYGLTGMGLSIVDILSDAQSIVVDYQMSEILEDNYFRLEPVIPKIKIDDASSKTIGKLIGMTKDYIRDNEKLIDNILANFFKE